jgi:type I restriction enzyme M protein
MLTSEIKQKIDSARNILVGKIPTPTGQVEQITLALIYKFMNDIDEQNKELGGELKFFTGEYSKYAWKNLLDKSLSAYERVTSYGEGLEKMHLNPNLPQFFRNVFRGAFLPFRDPEVLTIFLKQIDEFRYGVNGDLGDAFEYLLQVMGTQGDAGQFLTPRHIINFIVSVVDPQKSDKILDPAVGTAGFLISAYQHLLKQNTLEGSNKPGSALTIDDRKRFVNNFVGYDVSHDLVRLSLVNLYLHNFADPKIYEYDTLGNVDRWDDDFDCILTNPPFMTPKGGVKPHKKFSIKAKRSEVLFVDYIMEHLNPNGKAGIIVPEGIIFQSATAYKALRKMMIEQNFLYAVVSLPAGVFNPYSGVKTSILFMDRVLAKKTKDILFVKVENDGFDLGAQRRPIDKNDLPRAAEILKRYKLSIQTGEPFELSDDDKQIASLIPVEKISKSRDCNLSGDRYKETITLVNQKWTLVELGEVIEFVRGVTYSKNDESEEDDCKIVLRANNIDLSSGKIIFSDLKKVSGKLSFKESQKLLKGDILICTASGSADHIGKVGYSFDDTPYYVGGFMGVIRTRNEVDPKYLYSQLKNEKFRNYLIDTTVGANIRNLNFSSFSTFQIPLPPLEVQQEIVSQLDSYQKIIDGAKQIVDNYKPEIKIDPSWTQILIGEALKDIKYTQKVQKSEFLEFGKYPIIDQSEKFIAGYWNDDSSVFRVKTPIILFGDHTRSLKYIDFDFILGADGVKILQADERFLPRFFYYALLNTDIPNLGYSRHYKELVRLQIPLPPLDIQKQIVARIEEEQQIVDANKKLIQLFEDKIKERIGEVWGE